MINYKRLSNLIIVTWIFSIITILITYCLWSLNRGLDMTDESYYLAAAIHPESVVVWATAMHWITSILWDLSGSLVKFRGLGMAILVISSVVFALGVAHAFERLANSKLKYHHLLFIVASSLTGALLYNAFVTFTPSYNLLAASGTYIALGLAFFTLNINTNWLKIFIQIFVGIALGITFLAKFSSGVIACLIVAAILTVFRHSFKTLLLNILALAIGMLTTLAVLILLHTSFADAFAQFKLGALVYMLGANETFTVRLLRYIRETSVFLQLTIIDFYFPLLIYAMHAFRPRTWVALSGLVSFIYIVVSQGYLFGGMDKYAQQTAPLLVAVILSLLTMHRKGQLQLKIYFLFAILLLLPIGISIGTFNPLHVQIILCLAPWGLLIGLLAVDTKEVYGLTNDRFLLGVVFLSIVTSQIVTNGFRAPYRQYRPFFEQNAPINIPLLGNINLDTETRDSYYKLKHLADTCNIKPNEKFIGLYNIPGVSLILQTITLGMPILQDRISTEPILAHFDKTVLNSAILGINRDTESYDSSMPRQLAAFPQEYRLCGTVVLPYQKQKLELWIKN